MKVEIFTLCDAATADSGGKLNILGSFDRLNANTTPVTHPLCALAIKLRFERLEEGQKRISISFVDSDGKAVMPMLDASSQVSFPPGREQRDRVHRLADSADETPELRRVFHRSRG